MYIISLFLLILQFQNNQNIYFHLESRTLAQQKVVIVKANIYFKYDEGKMITHFTYPTELISITNNKGEAQIYDPKSKTVLLKRGLFFSTENDNIFLFLRERYDDLGLIDLGYKLTSRKKEKGYTVSEWIPKKESEEISDKIIIAHDNQMPVYMAIYNKDKIIRKVYYSGYAPYGNYFLPNRVTEIAYIKNDSIVIKKEYTNFTLGGQNNHAMFDFKIPANAKIIQSK